MRTKSAAIKKHLPNVGGLGAVIARAVKPLSHLDLTGSILDAVRNVGSVPRDVSNYCNKGQLTELGAIESEIGIGMRLFSIEDLPDGDGAQGVVARSLLTRNHSCRKALRDCERPLQIGRFEASTRYRTLFLRELCARLDAAVQEECKVLRAQGVDEIEYPEVDAALLERYIEVMASGSSGASVMAAGSTPDAEFTTHSWPASATSTSTTGGDDEDVDLLKCYLSVTIRQEGTAISKGTTGLRAWEAGLRLAAHLISDPSVIISPGTRILELGSGTGIVGAICATQQMSSSQRDVHTFMTDMPGQVSARLRDTLHLNGLDAASGIVEVKELDWLELVAERQQSQQRDDLPTVRFVAEARPTLILAADVVYDPGLIEPLVETIRACLQAGTGACKALVASTIRNSKTYDSFKASLESFGLKAKSLLFRVTFFEAEICTDNSVSAQRLRLPFVQTERHRNGESGRGSLGKFRTDFGMDGFGPSRPLPQGRPHGSERWWSLASKADNGNAAALILKREPGLGIPDLAGQFSVVSNVAGSNNRLRCCEADKRLSSGTAASLALLRRAIAARYADASQ
ncbi:hypothetical protein PHSY_001682 [Pseudozyma hubeiensis SY62]|uniref:Uncharacterized protein n=1 Tax=Pseudozyma hubeiensis (strain SY62) TaxID=1305764 RepID=R9NZ42_PSEHS|nr:hypothetical protein PHSY_001682 [Pseudozyma hubeiensis SY62]GAC94113.1 hypothetical protein PHSY_001682 [Pseudozyma hubeiensis SY62]